MRLWINCLLLLVLMLCLFLMNQQIQKIQIQLNDYVENNTIKIFSAYNYKDKYQQKFVFYDMRQWNNGEWFPVYKKEQDYESMLDEWRVYYFEGNEALKKMKGRK